MEFEHRFLLYIDFLTVQYARYGRQPLDSNRPLIFSSAQSHKYPQAPILVAPI